MLAGTGGGVMSPKLKRWQEEALTTALLRDPRLCVNWREKRFFVSLS